MASHEIKNHFLVSVPYEEVRREFFLLLMDKFSKKLKWWQRQKPGKRYSLIAIMGECSACGDAIGFIQDAINALDGCPKL